MEAIQSLDLNFTNQAGGHTASLGTYLNAKNVQTGADLGVVIGDLGEVNSFSNEKLNNLMANFICTDITTQAGPTVTAKTRKYVDTTTLRLKSHMVLLRGRNCGPRETLDFGLVDPENPSRVYGGEVPFFGEVINSPNIKDSLGREFPFPSLAPQKHGTIIAAGRIYNYESAAEYDGIKINLVYNNRELKDKLSLNADAVSVMYKGFKNENNVFFGGPDLQQYDLRLGYTLKDFFSMLALADVQMDPDNNLSDADGAENVLFETSGTLESVVSAVASYLGYFWFVNPFNGYISFINTQEATKLPIINYTDPAEQAKDENIIDANYTESLQANKIVNVYAGTGEKGEDKEQKNEDRPRKVFFKRFDPLDVIDWAGFGRPVQWGPIEEQTYYFFEEEIGALFALFNQGSDDAETFDKFMLLLQFCNWLPWYQKHPLWGIPDGYAGARWGMDLTTPPTFQKEYCDPEFPFTCTNYPVPAAGGGIDPPNLIYESLYPDKPICFNKFEWGPEPEWDEDNPKPANGPHYLWPLESQATHKERVKSSISYGPAKDDYYDRVEDDFLYIQLNKAPRVKMAKPSETDLYTFMKAYYAIAGGIYISNGYSRYRTERMQFQNTNNLTVVGPLKGDTLISDVDDLSQLNDVLSLLDVTDEITVNKMWQTVHSVKDGKMSKEPTNDYHFIAIRNLPKLERKNGQENDLLVDFKYLKRLEFLEGAIAGGETESLYLGGPRDLKGDHSKEEAVIGLRDMEQWLNKAVSLSWSNYKKAKLLWKKSIPMEYKRSKTRVNKIDEDPFEEEKEDNDVSEGTSSENKMAELFDRFDLKYFRVSAPDYNILNNLSLSSFSGGISEMIALEKIKGEYQDEDGQKVKTSSRTLYGLLLPEEYTPTMNSISLRIAGEGITTDISESTIKLIPPDSTFLSNKANEAAVNGGGVTSWLNSSQRNFMGL